MIRGWQILRTVKHDYYETRYLTDNQIWLCKSAAEAEVTNRNEKDAYWKYSLHEMFIK